MSIRNIELLNTHPDSAQSFDHALEDIFELCEVTDQNTAAAWEIGLETKQCLRSLPSVVELSQLTQSGGLGKGFPEVSPGPSAEAVPACQRR